MEQQLNIPLILFLKERIKQRADSLLPPLASLSYSPD